MSTLSGIASHQDLWQPGHMLVTLLLLSCSCYRPIARLYFSERETMNRSEKENVSCIEGREGGRKRTRKGLSWLTHHVTFLIGLFTFLRDSGAIPVLLLSRFLSSVFANVSRIVLPYNGRRVDKRTSLLSFWLLLLLHSNCYFFAIFRTKILVGKQCNLFLLATLSIPFDKKREQSNILEIELHRLPKPHWMESNSCRNLTNSNIRTKTTYDSRLSLLPPFHQPFTDSLSSFSFSSQFSSHAPKLSQLSKVVCPHSHFQIITPTLVHFL